MTKEELKQFICGIFNVGECPAMILKQINKYVTERGYNYLDIARALSYFVDVQGNQPQIKYGIGIVPLVMDDARKYYAKLKAQADAQRQAAKVAKDKNTNIIQCGKVGGGKQIKRPHIDISKLD